MVGANSLEELSDEELLRLLVKHRPDKYQGLGRELLGLTHDRPARKKQFSYDTTTHSPMPDLSPLPPGQRRAVEALIGGGVDRTYPEAARVAGMAEGTLLTHINRVSPNPPKDVLGDSP